MCVCVCELGQYTQRYVHLSVGREERYSVCVCVRELGQYAQRYVHLSVGCEARYSVCVCVCLTLNNCV